jgi:hypothetical protein
VGGRGDEVVGRLSHGGPTVGDMVMRKWTASAVGGQVVGLERRSCRHGGKGGEEEV